MTYLLAYLCGFAIPIILLARWGAKSASHAIVFVALIPFIFLAMLVAALFVASTAPQRAPTHTAHKVSLW